MKPCLVDVNVWIALLARNHIHHRTALEWFETLAPGEAGICRVVQLGVVRLLCNPKIMDGHEVSVLESWNAIERLLEDERVWFVQDAAGVDSIFPDILPHGVPATKLVTDAYLASLALVHDCPLTTLDRAFRSFRGLEVRILS